MSIILSCFPFFPPSLFPPPTLFCWAAGQQGSEVITPHQVQRGVSVSLWAVNVTAALAVTPVSSEAHWDEKNMHQWLMEDTLRHRRLHRHKHVVFVLWICTAAQKHHTIQKTKQNKENLSLTKPYHWYGQNYCHLVQEVSSPCGCWWYHIKIYWTNFVVWFSMVITRGNRSMLESACTWCCSVGVKLKSQMVLSCPL